VAGVDVHHREGKTRRSKGPHRDMQHDDGVLATRKKDDRAFETRGNLADDRNGLVFEAGDAGAHGGRDYRNSYQFSRVCLGRVGW